MEYRHVNVFPGWWREAVVIHSIWVRGSDEDIEAVIHEVKVNTESADALRKAIPHSKADAINLKGRYPDYKQSFYKKATAEFTSNRIRQIEEMREWLKSRLIT